MGLRESREVALEQHSELGPPIRYPELGLWLAGGPCPTLCCGADSETTGLWQGLGQAWLSGQLLCSLPGTLDRILLLP